MAAREIAVGEPGLYAAIEAESIPATPAADVALLTRLKAGERAAFEELVATYHRSSSISHNGPRRPPRRRETSHRRRS